MGLKHKSLLVNNYDFFISVNIDKGNEGLEMNSSIKQRRVKKSHKSCPVKKSHKSCPVLSFKSLKHKYDSFSGIKSELLHGYF